MIRQAGQGDLPALTALALRLWPDNDPQALEAELAQALCEGSAFFLSLAEGAAVGFAQCQLRRDYVEGTSSSPVGYLEGVYVAPAFRRQGRARGLLAACEAWARAAGCREFASDCALDNAPSAAFHLGSGFREAGRIRCFVKALD